MALKRPLTTGGASGVQEVPDADTVAIPGGAAIGQTGAPNAKLTLGAGTATAGTAPLRLTSGVLLTAPEPFALEANGDALYHTKQSGLRLGLGGVLWEAYTDAGNSGTGETDLYSYTTPANTLASNGTKLLAKYGLQLNDGSANLQIKVYFGGTAIIDFQFTNSSGINPTGLMVDVMLIRTGTSTARAVVSALLPRNSYYATMTTDLTGLTFTNTNILKITATVTGTGAATNDVVAKLGTILWYPPANT